MKKDYDITIIRDPKTTAASILVALGELSITDDIRTYDVSSESEELLVKLVSEVVSPAFLHLKKIDTFLASKGVVSGIGQVITVFQSVEEAVQDYFDRKSSSNE